jgi:integrase/recombinase XerD
MEQELCEAGEPTEGAVVRVWLSRGRTAGTTANYIVWVRLFRVYCERAHLDMTAHLTRATVARFAGSYVGRRAGRSLAGRSLLRPLIALRAWSHGLKLLGRAVPEWSPPPKRKALPAILREYRGHRLRHAGVSESTIYLDMKTAEAFFAFLRTRNRRVANTSVADLDAFVASLGQGRVKKTVASMCSSLRSLLRFLESTGRQRHSLAASVVAPRILPMAQPPRALPWADVQRLIRAVKRDVRNGDRDFAILLLMATYGLGAAEVTHLRLEDINWRADSLRVRRPKTGVEVLLPLLPEVARAIASYIKRERPKHVTSRELFVSTPLPNLPITSSGSIYYLIRKHAKEANIKIDHLGCHALRHSHACRQVDVGTNMKVLGDILGHRHPTSTSVYVRVALKRLRQVGLPVP